MPDRSRSLLRHPDFLKLWTGETVSVFGDAITGLAVPLIAASVLNVTAFVLTYAYLAGRRYRLLALETEVAGRP